MSPQYVTEQQYEKQVRDRIRKRRWRNENRAQTKARASWVYTLKKACTANGKSHYRRWTPEELKAVFDTTRTDFEIAKELGRSSLSIAKARMNYREFAPPGWKGKADNARIDEPEIEKNLPEALKPYTSLGKE